MKVDTNTNGHRQWFFFSIRNKQKGKIKLKIYKFKKHYSLFQRGMRPYTLSIKNGGQWKPSGQNICYKKQRLPNQYGILKNSGCYYLTFDYKFQNDDDQVYFAAGIPYTYSFLQRRLKQLQALPLKKISFVVQKYGKSMCGLDLNLITVEPLQLKNSKPKIIVVNARTHSGQTSSSWVMDGFLNQICTSYEVQQWINRQNICLKIFPMLNPDGVFVGNYRTGIIGDDFNRKFYSGKKEFFPQINSLKKIVIQSKKVGDVHLFLDLHGHSILKNSFIFGPAENEFGNSKLKKLPFYLWHSSKYFRMGSCRFKSQKDKIQTARIYFQIKQSILSFTCQNSLGLYFNQNKTIQMKKQDWLSFGQSIIKSMIASFDQSLPSFKQPSIYINQSEGNQKIEKFVSINSVSLNQQKKVTKKKQICIIAEKQKLRKDILSDFRGTLAKSNKQKQISLTQANKASTKMLVNEAKKRLPSLNSKQYNGFQKPSQSSSKKNRQSLKLSSNDIQQNQRNAVDNSKEKFQQTKFKIRRRSQMIKYLPQQLKDKISMNKIQFSPSKKYNLDQRRMERSMTFDESYLSNQIATLAQLQQNKPRNNHQIQNQDKMSIILQDDFSDKYNDSINDSDCSSEDLCQQEKNYIMDYIRANQIRKRERFDSLQSLKSQEALQMEELSPPKTKINAFKQILFQPQSMQKQMLQNKNKTFVQFNNNVMNSKQIHRNPHKFKQTSSHHGNGNKSFGGMKLTLGQQYQDQQITIIQRKKLNERLGKNRKSQRDPFILMYIKQKNEGNIKR